LVKHNFTETYKNWSFAAANKLAVVIYQICNIQSTFLDKLRLANFREPNFPLLRYFSFFKNAVNSTVDNATDSDLKDFVIPNLKEVKLILI
jgi:6-phosphogluconate dehydrogenase